MKKLNIYLQRPWKYSDSPYYLYLRQNPPSNVIYSNSSDFKLIQNKSHFRYNNFLKRNAKRFLRLLPWMPNAHYTKDAEKYDLIHCAHCLSFNKKPWICDIEFANQLWAGVKETKSRNSILKLLKSSYCKKIIPWTKWAADSVLKNFPEIKDKVEVVYPAIPEQNFKKIKSKKITLLFVSRRFYFKGGLHALEIIDRLTKNYPNVEGIIVSEVPENVKNRYSSNKKITFYGMMPQEKLFKEIYPKSDIFIYPSYTDTFGFPILEAMSFGLPVIAVEGHSRRELINEGKTGFVVSLSKPFEASDLENLSSQKQTIELLEKRTEHLINKKLINKMSKNCLKEVKDGKFSIKRRNKILYKIYTEALK